jgi:hypothetical protein|tara:strand:- start:4615 stop:5016 length:402 start_codon:yes stop_codon:yes gene_type:complete
VSSADEINRVVGWAYDKGYHVAFDRYGDNSVCYESKTVSIKNTSPIRVQLHTLLHECGHILVHVNNSPFDFKRVDERFSSQTSTKKVYTVIEEVEAWKRGKQLASRLYISLDEDKWDMSVARAIKAYMKWALE